jgi:intracellular septation protein A
VRDGFGPLVMFFAGWKLIGLGAGIGAAVVFGLTLFVYERRQGRPAAVVRLALVLVAIRATVGLTSGSATAYLATEIGIDMVLGSAVLASLASQRPFASWFAGDIYAFPQEVRDSASYRQAMRRITTVWGAYFLVRALVRLTALLTLSTNSYVLVIALTDAPCLIALLAWSVYYTVRVFRRSEEWGPIVAAAEASP